MSRYLLGVDDTDSAKSPTTGELVRGLAELLQTERMAQPLGVTRHQLLAKKPIPYTGHNSAACLLVDAEDMEGVWETARDFLAFRSVGDSNVGMSISRWETVSHDVIAWGKRAKTEVLKPDEAKQVAAKSHVRLVEMKGNGSGIIGALAAIGLHREGNDGRFLWLPGLFELQGKCSVEDIFERSGIDRVCSLEDIELPITELVELGDWMRPVLHNGQATLYVEERKHGWAVLDKERIKELSS